MAPAITAMHELAARYSYCPSGYYYRNGYCYSRSKWNQYGRWIVTAAIVIFFILILALLAMRARKRRAMGRPANPTGNTGWMGRFGNHQQQGAPQYGANYAAPPPPEYSQQPPAGYQQPYKPFEGQQTGTTYDSNQGYYGSGQPQANGQGPNDIQLQQPTQAYYPTRGGAADDYAPPEGPPPAKH